MFFSKTFDQTRDERNTRWGNVVYCVVQGEEDVEETSAEILYLGMLPNLSQYVVSSW